MFRRPPVRTKAKDRVKDLGRLKRKAIKWQEKCIEACDLSNIPIYLSDSVRFLDGHKTTKSGAEIDSQKNSLYCAQDKVRDEFDDETFVGVDECQEYLDYVTDLQWMKRRWPTKSFSNIKVSSPGLSRSYARANRVRNKISVPANEETNKWTLLHELAHLVVPQPHAWHGRLFVRTFMEITKWRYDKQMYQDFKQACREENVNYSPKRKAPWE